MEKYQITCCSTADMPIEYFNAKELPYACFKFVLDGNTYPDDLGQTITYDEFYSRIKDGAMPVTSQVNPEEYIELFEPFLINRTDIIHLSLSSGISGSYNSALIAADMMKKEYPDRMITIIDSLAASSGYGLLVDAALSLQQTGISYDELTEWIEENKLKVHHWFFSTDLTHFLRGGRISAASCLFGTMLNICPLMNVSNKGELIPRTKIRGKSKAVKEIVRRMEMYADNRLDYSGKCFISNSACREDAEQVAVLIQERFPKLYGKVVINSIGATIGAHTGIGTVALFFWGDKRID